MWYTGRSGASGEALGTLAVGYAASLDGVNWRKYAGNPVLEGGEADWEERGVATSCVTKLPTGKYMMWYAGYSGIGKEGVTLAIGQAESPSGVSWTKEASPILTGGQPWEARGVGAPCVVKAERDYFMFYSGVAEKGASGFESAQDFTVQVGAAVLSPQAETTLAQGLFTGTMGKNRVMLPVNITKVNDPLTNEPIEGVEIGAYKARAPYDSDGIEMLNVRGGDSPFNDPTSEIGDRDVSFEQSPEGSAPVPVAVAGLVPRLIGSAKDTYELPVYFDEIEDEEGNPIFQQMPASLTFQRGDAREDGEVKITDAMFIAQYRVGLRPLESLNPLNAASVRHDGDEGERITIHDAMFIAQYCAGYRDEYFAWY